RTSGSALPLDELEAPISLQPQDLKVGVVPGEDGTRAQLLREPDQGRVREVDISIAIVAQHLLDVPIGLHGRIDHRERALAHPAKKADFLGRIEKEAGFHDDGRYCRKWMLMSLEVSPGTSVGLFGRAVEGYEETGIREYRRHLRRPRKCSRSSRFVLCATSSVAGVPRCCSKNALPSS